MPYIDENLSPGEEIRYRAKVHWSIYIPAIVTLIFGVIVLCRSNSKDVSPLLIIFAIFLYFLLRAVLYSKTTELAITNQRIIAKTGFVRRNTVEQRLEKVDNVGVHQSALQRLLDAGSVRITGSGASQTPITNIESPLNFRREVNNAIDSVNYVPSKFAGQRQ